MQAAFGKHFDDGTYRRTLLRRVAEIGQIVEGAQNWARIASHIATCKMNGVEPFAYMRATLEAIAAGHPHADLDDLLPWAFSRTAVKAAA